MKKLNAKTTLILSMVLAIIITTTLLSTIFYHSIKEKQIQNSELIFKAKTLPVQELIDKISSRSSNNRAIFNGQNIKSIRELLSDSIFYNTGFPYLINYKGIITVHPFTEGKSIKDEIYFDRIITSKYPEGIFTLYEAGTKKSYYYNNLKEIGSILILSADYDEVYAPLLTIKKRLTIITILLIVILSIASVMSASPIFGALSNIKSFIIRIKNADYATDETIFHSKDFNNIKTELNSICNYLNSINDVAEKISKGELISNKENLKQDDKLLLSLYKIEDNIKESREAEEQRRKEDEKTNWVNQGLAKFSEILRMHSEDFSKQADNIIQNIVRYVNANQGGLFILNSDNKKDIHLELISAFAYDSKKFIEKRIPYGEGLVGTCAIEKETIYLKEVPDDYIEITSGLGEALPRSILIVPIKMEEEVLGIIEIASFNELEDHEISFIEKIMESVASTLSSAKINARTNELLQKFELQSNDMAEKEEEMRQNIEELQATQEEASNKEFKLRSYINAFSNSILSVEYNTDGVIKDVNENFCELFGECKKELTNRTIQEQIATSTAVFENFESTWHSLLNGNQHKTKTEYQLQGTTYTIQEIYSPIKDKNGNTISILRFGIIEDSKVNE